jgi:hypothetical protein
MALATRDTHDLAALLEVRERLGRTDTPLVGVRALPSDVHDVGTLAAIANVLCPG